LPTASAATSAVFKADLKTTRTADANGAFVIACNPRFVSTVIAGTSVAGAYTYATATAVGNVAGLTPIYNKVRCTGGVLTVTGSASITTASGNIATAILPVGDSLPTSYANTSTLDGARSFPASRMGSDVAKCVWVPNDDTTSASFLDSAAVFDYTTITDAAATDVLLVIAGSGLVVGENITVEFYGTYEGVPDYNSANFVGAKKQTLYPTAAVAHAHLRRAIVTHGRGSVVDAANEGAVAQISSALGLKTPGFTASSIGNDVSDASKIFKFGEKNLPAALKLAALL
jgi:hypothetical protein